MSLQPWYEIHKKLNVSFASWAGETVAEIVASHAQEKPDRAALVFNGNVITYEELDIAVGEMALVLKNKGLTQGDVVGVCMPNTPCYVFAIVAIARLGLTCSNVSPLYKKSEIEHQIQDSNITLMLIHQEIFESLSSDLSLVNGEIIVCGDDLMDVVYFNSATSDGNVVALSDCCSALGKGVSEQVAVQQDSVFVLQYTGGTTGKPKGAMISHLGLMTNINQICGLLPLVEYQETLCTPFPLFHAAGLLLHILGLVRGATVVLVREPRDLNEIAGALISNRPTVIACVPALYQMLLGLPLFCHADFSRLRYAITGAAPMPMSVQSELESVIGKGKVCDLFGMTESGPVHTMNPPGHRKSGSVGIPVGGVDIRIVEIGRPNRCVPLNEPGEIMVYSPSLMLGYLNMERETVKAMPLVDGRCWLMTGDVARMDEDGYLFLCDRAKDMLIVGGFKVFSTEIEEKLLGLPCIDQIAIVGCSDNARPGNDKVCAVVVAAKGFSEEAVKVAIGAFSREQMAPYKAPKDFKFKEALPLTSVGKIDKKQLRQELSARLAM